MRARVLNTGQKRCYDTAGLEVGCADTGQDAEEAPGVAWPEPRFRVPEHRVGDGGGDGGGDVVLDRLTRLEWTRRANYTELPVRWAEAFEVVAGMNREGFGGHRDWRLPDRWELRSLVSHQARDPALPRGHPFQDVFLGWYWTSTTAAPNPAYAWSVHFEGGRMFYGHKDEYRLVWPVRGSGVALPRREPRFDAWTGGAAAGADAAVLDRWTGLVWSRCADLAGRWTTWSEAFEVVAALDARAALSGRGGWRLPTINELESLVDAARHAPALPAGHPFQGVQEAYWSSTTSAYETDWAMALYMAKGAVGVGQKKDPNFSVWAVSRPEEGRRRRQPGGERA